MARKLYSPTRTISNRGEYPRFIGQYRSPKGPGTELAFDSISALLCGIYLEWRQDVARIEFEPRQFHFNATAGLPKLKFIPDYVVTLDSGEIELDEAKYSLENLSDKEQTKLQLAASHCERDGLAYHVRYRKDLEKDGFIDTVLLLRRYGQLIFPAELVSQAEVRLLAFPAAPLETWRLRAAQNSIPTGLLYYLLYHQRLPLTYRRLLFVEFLTCRA